MPNLTHVLVTGFVRSLVSVICRIDAAELAKVPAQGPLIAVANHVNFLDVPVVFPRLMPRPVTGFVKYESWDNPVFGFLFNLWDAIPLRRGEADLSAIRQALAALAKGSILAVAPEGTRSGDGKLLRGHPGVVLLALRSGAPLLPMAYYGSENYKSHWRRLRRTPFTVRVGSPFYLSAGDARVTQEVRQQMVDEIMYQVAALLPPHYRGHYSDLEAASTHYLRFSAPLGAMESCNG